MDSLVKNDALEFEDELKSKIYTIRGIQVMLDSDLAELYCVETKRINEQVRRNMGRFPLEFCFKLTETEMKSLRSQNATSKKRGGTRYYPFVFTEQGVAMLSAVLKSDEAIRVSVGIMKAFVKMRHFIHTNGGIVSRVDQVEKKLVVHEIKTDEKFERIFKTLDGLGQIDLPKQGIFYNGQVFDAHTFTSDLIRSAKKSLLLIDNFVDDTVLTLLSKRKTDVSATIYTKKISKQLELDLFKHNYLILLSADSYERPLERLHTFISMNNHRTFINFTHYERIIKIYHTGCTPLCSGYEPE
ncbi:MAG: ORF6N domain-containing protein [Fibrobacterales bacterium]